MIDSLLRMLPDVIAKPLSLAFAGLGFLVLLFLKLCFSTALFATLAEITRRLQVFRASRRPAVRALLLLPAVILFCTAVLFVLNLWRLFGSGFALTGAYLLGSCLSVVGLGLAVAIGAVVGFLLAPRIPMGLDRFGCVLTQNRGRYLAFWMGTFSLCGVFQMLPWGWVTYWTIWVLLLGAALVASVHWQLYARLRALRTAPSPGLPPGPPLNLALDPREALALSILVREGRPCPPQVFLDAAKAPDAALLAHPAWFAETLQVLQDPRLFEPALQSLSARGLCVPTAQGWVAAGQALRLGAFTRVDDALGLTVKRGGACRTVVLQRLGPAQLLLEPGPDGLLLQECAPGLRPEALLRRALGA